MVFMNEWKAKGFCYFCEEPYPVEYSLTHNKKL